MTCEIIRDRRHAGGIIVACSRGQRWPTCQECKRVNCARLLCDYPLSGREKGTTCDRKLCERCAVQQGHPSISLDRHYCPAHARLAATGTEKQEVQP